MENNNLNKYKFRAECTADAQAIRAVLLPWLVDWQETRANFEYDGVLCVAPSVVVELSLLESAPNLGEILWLVDGIDNCHVVADTFDTVENYTGQRKFRKRFVDQAERPSKGILDKVMESVRTRQKILALENERALQLHKTYRTLSVSGGTSQSLQSLLNSPAWFLPVPHEDIGLVELLRIDAPLGCKNWEKKGDKIVKERLITIDG